MVLRIGDVEISGGIQRDAPWIAELARVGAWATDYFQRVAGGIENLDAAVAEFADVLTAGAIDADVVRIAQFAFACARLAVGADEFAIAIKDLDAMIAGVGDEEMVLLIDAKAFG